MKDFETQYLTLKRNLTAAFLEVKEMQKGTKPKISLNDFLKEC